MLTKRKLFQVSNSRTHLKKVENGKQNAIKDKNTHGILKSINQRS